MNSKKCKALRKALRAEVDNLGLALRAEVDNLGLALQPNGLTYRLPRGWSQERYKELTQVGGPWAVEAYYTARKPQAVNTPGSMRWFYRGAKKHGA